MELCRCCCRRFRRRRNQLINAGRLFEQIRTLLEVGFDVIDSITGTRNFVTRSIHIHHEACRRYANQYQHYQTNTFLPIVSAMRKRHTDSGEDQRDTRPERRLFLTVFLFTLCWCQVNTCPLLGAVPVTTQQEDQTASEHQTDNRGNDQRTENIEHFRDVKCIHH